MPKTEVSPHSGLIRLLMGNRPVSAIYVAAKLGIPDLLRDGPRSVEELAREAEGIDADALRRLLRVLAGLGIFYEDDSARFGLTPMASLLRTDVPGSLRPVALWSGGIAYRVFGELEYSVRTGEPAFERLYGMEFFEYLATHPDAGSLFDAFMARTTASVAPAVVGAYDFHGLHTIVDVAGGRGELLATILNTGSELRGVLFDRPSVIQGARPFLQNAGVADRCRLVAGDLDGDIPAGGDAYVLKSLVHGVSDDVATGWLGKVRRVLAPSGRLLLIEFVIPPGNDPFPGKNMDLLMLVGSRGGRERTKEEFEALLQHAGFRLSRIAPTDAGYSILEAVAA